jgi:RNA polymerase sigma-70 factor (ECF subfamily)
MVPLLRLLPPPAPPATPDEACLAAFQEQLDYVWRTMRRLGTQPSEVEGLVQEVFLVLRRSWSEYDPQRPLLPYLFGIVFRVVCAHQRKYRREVISPAIEVGDAGPDSEDALQAQQARAVVLAALDRIPLPRRAILVMHDLDGVPVRDAAAALSIPRFTAYSRLRKARKELAIALRRLKEPAAP